MARAPVAKKPKLAADVQQLVGIAAGLRAEYSADILLRLIEAGKVPDRELKFELLEDVFQSAPQAVAPLPLVDVISKTDTLSRRLGEAHRQRLDTLSIQLRLVEALLKDDPLKARQTFARIPPLALPRSGCEQALVPDVLRYYIVVGELYERSFSAMEKEKRDNISFLRQRFAEVNSIPQLAPARLLLSVARIAEAEVDTLITELAVRIAIVGGTDREWRAAARDLLSSGDLQEVVQSSGLTDGSLAKAWRTLLYRRAQAPQCSESQATRESEAPSVSLGTLMPFGGAHSLEVKKNSNDPVIAAYALLESIAPLPFVWGK